MMDDKEVRVEVYVPRGAANEEQQLFVGVNGRSYLLPRGKKSLVPLPVAEELRRSALAQEEQDRRIDRMLEAMDKQ